MLWFPQKRLFNSYQSIYSVNTRVMVHFPVLEFDTDRDILKVCCEINLYATDKNVYKHKHWLFFLKHSKLFLISGIMSTINLKRTAVQFVCFWDFLHLYFSAFSQIKSNISWTVLLLGNVLMLVFTFLITQYLNQHTICVVAK